MTKIDVDALFRISDLFRFRWDPPILAILVEHPCRFRALHTRLETRVGEHVDDNALTRSLRRLIRAGMIHADAQRLGHRVIKTYSLSDKGRKHLSTYEAIVSVYTHLHPTGDEGNGTCPTDDRQPDHTDRHTDACPRDLP